MEKPSDSKLTFIKFARALIYLVYAFAIIATVFLSLGFVLLLLGANASVPFVQFVYNIAAEFLQPFRGIFPPHQINDRSYFSSAGLFAIIMYSLGAVGLHSLIDYLTLKQANHERDLLQAQLEIRKLKDQERLQRELEARNSASHKPANKSL